MVFVVGACSRVHYAGVVDHVGGGAKKWHWLEYHPVSCLIGYMLPLTPHFEY